MSGTAAAPAAPAASAAPANGAGADNNGKGKLPAIPASGNDGGKPENGQRPPEGMTPAEKKIWKLKVFDKEIDFDASDEKKLQVAVQRGLAADERFQYASQVEKQLDGIIRMLRESPEKVLLNEKLGHNPEMVIERIVKALGPNARPIVEKIMGRYVDEELMDPKDREIAEHKRKIAEFEAEQKKIKDEDQRKQMETLRAHYQESYSKDIVNTLENSGLPKTPATVKRMAYYMHQGLARGVELKASDVVEFVKQDYINETGELYGALDGDVLLSILGPQLSDKIVKAVTTARNAPRGPLRTPPAGEQPSGDEPQGKKRFITSDEFRSKFGA